MQEQGCHFIFHNAPPYISGYTEPIPSKSDMKVFFVSPLNFWLVFKSGNALSQGHYQNRAYTWLLPCAPLFW